MCILSTLPHLPSYHAHVLTCFLFTSTTSSTIHWRGSGSPHWHDSPADLPSWGSTPRLLGHTTQQGRGGHSDHCKCHLQWLRDIQVCYSQEQWSKLNFPPPADIWWAGLFTRKELLHTLAVLEYTIWSTCLCLNTCHVMYMSLWESCTDNAFSTVFILKLRSL